MLRSKFFRAAWGLGTVGLLALIGCDAGSGDDPAMKPGNPASTSTPAPNGGGSGGGSTTERPRILFVTNSNADWWNAVEKGMRDGGAEFGCDVEMRRNEGTPQGQIRILGDALVLADVKGVAVSVIEAESAGVADALEELKKAGKVVLAIDSDIAPASAHLRRAYIGTDNHKAGEVAGKAAATIRPDGGKTLVFVGTAAAANAIARREGFFAGAGPKFVQGEIFEDGGDKAKAQSNVQTAVTKYPDLGVLLGLWSYNAPRIAEEVSTSAALRKQASVVTFDLDELTVGHLEAGNIDASVCQNPYDMGYKGVRLLKAFIQDDKAVQSEMLPGGATTIETGVRVIVPKADSPIKGENVITIDEMKTWLTSKGLKSS